MLLSDPTSEVIAVVVATSVAQFGGAWTYLAAKRRAFREPVAATACGLVTTLIAAPAYILLDVHRWFDPQVSWGLSVFLAVCGGICQGALFRGRPLERLAGGSGARGA